jgi:hypothetical protein
LRTLQYDGVQGFPSSTLQGACENGVASMGRRRLASAVSTAINPAVTTTRQKTMRRSMTRALEVDHAQNEARTFLRKAGVIKPSPSTGAGDPACQGSDKFENGQLRRAPFTPSS